jgi:HEAT repeat protein
MRGLRLACFCVALLTSCRPGVRQARERFDALLRSQNLAGAEQLAARVSKANPKNADACLLIVRVKLHEGKTRAALEAYRQHYAAAKVHSPALLETLLLGAFSDREWSVRANACRVAGETGLGPAFARLVAATEDESPPVRTEAYLALSRTGHGKAARIIAAGYEDPDWQVRVAALKATRTLADRSSLNLLARCSEEPNEYVRFQTVLARASLGDETAAPLLRHEARQDAGLLGVEAAACLVRAGMPGYLSTVARALCSTDPETRSHAARTAGELESDSLRPLLLALAKDPDPLVRRSTAQALGRAAGTDAVPALLKMLRDADAGVREDAACALARLGTCNAVSDISGLLSDPDTEVRLGAVAALLVLTPVCPNM